MASKIAVLDIAENEPSYSFQETTSANVGIRLKWFISEAMKWLRE
jgi:hypothetical protein